MTSDPQKQQEGTNRQEKQERMRATVMVTSKATRGGTSERKNRREAGTRERNGGGRVSG